jgi:hypothetical protein
MPGWKTANLRVDNTPTYPELSVDMRADYVDLFCPITNDVLFTARQGLSLSCALNAFQPGFRDQAAPFVGGDQVWSYYIGNSTNGCVSTACGKRKPKDGGPDLSTPQFAGFDCFSPAFPFPMVTHPTFLPMLPGANEGGSTPIRVRNNRVHYKNAPLFVFPHLPDGQAYPQYWPIEIDLSAWVPTPDALTVMIQQDPELHSLVPTYAGFIPGFQDGNNYGNLSVYNDVPGGTAAQNTLMDIPIDDDAHLRGVWGIIGGVPKSYASVFILQGYSFSNG